jgi:S-adenosylmethionine:tRNA ribosyltransferase-isomerase
MELPPQINRLSIDDFDYPLPENRIAKFPVDERDQSKLLINRGIELLEDKFYNLAEYLPESAFLALNNTKVIRARLFFRKSTGATIEIFCLEPVSPTTGKDTAFAQTGSAVWRCYAGNARRWKDEKLKLEIKEADGVSSLFAEKIKKEGDTFLIEFSWKPAEKTFSEMLDSAGKIPLPPYLNRESIDRDVHTYQTVYAQYDGSVAAPTAGLHFTDRVFDSFAEKMITTDYLTLHVGAGTFKPVGKDGIAAHAMHTEKMLVSRKMIEKLIANHGKIIAVGTTGVRTLESLYIFGVKLKNDPLASFSIRQFDPYENDFDGKIDLQDAMGNILTLMDKTRLDVISGSTGLMIMPGYKFKVVNGMITNFHQPRSTLLLLISAWLGDHWRNVYHYALKNDFRFLSYGDSCLFL